ncbi:Retrovirus-related Pol polyprotein, partial [Mucuna pruriens]
MEEEARPLRQQQRRLNLTILDVVKKEVTKLLVVGIIYPISDSNWVSSMQVVSKKSRMTITKNQHVEMIHIALEDQHKKTFTCPFSTVAYARMSFGLYNALSRGIEVDKAKVDVITSLPNPTSVRDVRSFLRQAGFYRRFIRNFSRIALPLSRLLQKDVDVVFSKACVEAFEELKTKLTSTPILQAPNCELPFELMYDASNSTLRAVLS